MLRLQGSNHLHASRQFHGSTLGSTRPMRPTHPHSLILAHYQYSLYRSRLILFYSTCFWSPFVIAPSLIRLVFLIDKPISLSFFTSFFIIFDSYFPHSVSLTVFPSIVYSPSFLPHSFAGHHLFVHQLQFILRHYALLQYILVFETRFSLQYPLLTARPSLLPIHCYL